MKYLLIVLLMLTLAVGLGSAAPPLSIDGDSFVWHGQPVVFKGAMYCQPHAYHQFFWDELSLEKFGKDLDLMKSQGLNTCILIVNWGGLVSSVDQKARQWHPNTRNVSRFLTALDMARQRGMLVMLWFGTARIPEGINAKLNEAATDTGGVKHPPFLGYLWFDYPGCVQLDEYQWQAFCEFHRFVASLTRSFDNVIFDPLDWQHLDINAWCFDQPKNLEAWRAWLQAQHLELAYWNKRWSEHNASWDDVLLPVDSWVAGSLGKSPSSPYAGLKAIPYESAKWDDFNKWHNGLYNQVQADLIGALKEGNPAAPIGQRYDPWRFGHFRESTWAPEGVDFLCFGYYPSQPKYLGKLEELQQQWDYYQQRKPRKLPLLMWESGVGLKQLLPDASLKQAEAVRTQQMKLYLDFVRQHNMLGLGWWVWRDYDMNEDSSQWGLMDVTDHARPALELLGGFTR